MMADGVFLVDGDSFTKIGFIETGVGTHGLYPSRDGTKLYVANRGANLIHGPRHGKGSVTVIDFATRKVRATCPIPGRRQSRYGQRQCGRQDVVAIGPIRRRRLRNRYRHGFGEIDSCRDGTTWADGLAAARYSLGHTGNMR